MLYRAYFLLMCVLHLRSYPKCRLHPRIHFYEPLPIVIKDHKLLEPTDSEGNIEIEYDAALTLSCENGGTLGHPSAMKEVVTEIVTCAGDTYFKNADWLNGAATFSEFRCTYSPSYRSIHTERKCYDNNSVLEVGYKVQDQFYPLYESCFNEYELRVIYTKYSQRSYNAFFQTKVSRPFFVADEIFGIVPVTILFSPRGQKAAVGQLVGNMIDNYITNNQFLARGHLAAKTDFVFAFGERATFHYANCAPQWSGFNGGNWNTLEVDLRNHVHQAGYDVIIYTGTYGISQLLSERGTKTDLYLYSDVNNNPVIPVPLYFYKVVYEPATQRGIAFIGVNNPYFTPYEFLELVFCVDMCRRTGEFRWLTWHPDDYQQGFTFCCDVDDFRRTVPHLPPFTVSSLLP